MRLPFVGRATWTTYPEHEPQARDIAPSGPGAWDGTVRAAASGQVTFSGAFPQPCSYSTNGDEQQVIIKHMINGIAYYSQYDHFSSRSVVKDQWVSAGDPIGFYGSSGCTSNGSGGSFAHLHFQVKQGTTPINVDDLACAPNCTVVGPPVVTDRDGDGIPDASDACPDAREDFDGDRDTDGCPDIFRDFSAYSSSGVGQVAGYAMESTGVITAIGGAPPVTSSGVWNWEIARAIATLPGQARGYVLDGYGGLHPFGGAPVISDGPYWPDWDIARDVVLRPDGVSGYVLDGFGGIQSFGGAPVISDGPYWSGFDIARGIALRADGQSGYVLDGYGGVHAFGGAPGFRNGPYWPGWDIARAIVIRSDGASGYVLDGFGGINSFNNAPGLAPGGYWDGSDRARSIALSPGLQWGAVVLTTSGPALYSAVFQGDADYDGIADVSDNCPSVANFDQLNTDANNRALQRGGADGLGDACDGDRDGDGYTDAREAGLGRDALTYCAIMRADVNRADGSGDGYVNVIDLQHVAQLLNLPPPGHEDQNGDGVVNVIDLQRMASPAILGHAVTECP